MGPGEWFGLGFVVGVVLLAVLRAVFGRDGGGA